MPDPEPTRRRRPPPMVLVDSHLKFVDELQELIEKKGVTVDQYIDSALKSLPVPECSSSSGSRAREQQAYAMLRERRSAVRKEPLLGAIDGSHYLDLLDSVEPCLPPVVDAPPSVTRLSLKVSWPPGHLDSGYYPSYGSIASCHRCFLLLYAGTYRPLSQKPGFYLVYNALANSVAIVPPLFCYHMTHCDIGPPAILCLGIDQGDYLLAEIFRHGDDHLFATNKADFFIWASSSGDWVKREVVLPLPTPNPAAAAAAGDDDMISAGTFHADMAFAVSFSSICWVDLLKGILVYNHIHTQQFHFIPLPDDECLITSSLARFGQWRRRPLQYRSMCCVDRQTLKFVAMDESYSQDCPMLTTWTLRWPLSPTNWKWDKDAAVPSFSVRDLWEDQVYKDKLLQPLWPRCPVISSQEPHIIYLSLTDGNPNGSHYVLSLNMDRCRIEAVYKDPADGYAIRPPSLFASDFSRYLDNKTRASEVYEGPREKITDEERSKATPYTIGADFGLKLSTPGGPSSRRTPLDSSFCSWGLGAALDIAIA